MVITPNGRSAVVTTISSRGEAAQHFSATSGRVRLFRMTGRETSLSDDGRWLLLPAGSGDVPQLVDLRHPSSRVSLGPDMYSRPPDPIGSLSGDGRTAIVACSDSLFTVDTKAKTYARVLTRAEGAKVTSARISADGKHIAYIIGPYRDRGKLYEVSTASAKVEGARPTDCTSPK